MYRFVTADQRKKNTENTPSDKIGETFYSSQMFEVYETFAELADAIGKKLKGNWSLDDDPEEVTLKFDFKKDELILWISNIDGKFCKCQFDKETSNQIIDLFKKIILDNSFLFNFTNNRISCEEIVKHFSKLSKNFSKDKFDLDQSYFDRFKIEIKKILFQIIRLKNYFLNKESFFSSKYFDINVAEINLIIKKFRKIDSSKYKVSIKEIDNNVILIKNF